MGQIHLDMPRRAIVHYFDNNGALRSGYLVRRIEKGSKIGCVVVSDQAGNQVIARRIRNIE